MNSSRHLSRATRIFILGHENNGKIGSLINQCLEISELLIYLDDIREKCRRKYPLKVTMTCCNGHVFKNSRQKGCDYNNILVDAVTTSKMPLAVYSELIKNKVINISFMHYLLHHC